MRYLILFFVLSVLSACASHSGDRREVFVALEGERLEITDDASLFEIVYADDTVMIASVVSPENRLAAYRIGSDEAPYEFVRSGRGPLEVGNANFKSRNDTLYVLSHDGYGLRNIIRIPVSGIRDMSRWESADVSSNKGLFVGIDVLSSAEYIIPGGKLGDETLLGVLSAEDGQFVPLAFWPDDGYTGAPLPKQMMYLRGTKVFSNGDKILFACGEGRYFSVLDISDAPIKETFIYSEYPEYQASADGVNPEVKPGSKLGGIVYATDSLIYLSPIDCLMSAGRYVPEDYKGYPPYYNDRIEVYDWDGNYRCTYVTDIPFGSFYVNDGFIYTLTDNRETFLTEVYRYRIR